VLKRRRRTGPSDTVRQEVWDRSGGYCERCGKPVVTTAMSVHHRRPRRMGGTTDPAVNTPANLAILCGSGTTGCHGEIESHRTEAYADGWLLHTGQDPVDVPVRLRGGPMIFLTVEGGYRPLS
jgi:5-methylcytosine-specific restriction endonuclease McrA